MNMKENLVIGFEMWKMNCPGPRAYRFTKASIQTFITHYIK